VELMPVVAWMDERHLQPLGLTNAWGYNPVSLMALDPGLAPGGIAELRETVAALHASGIGVILDLVFNHTGESDVHGPILSLRGLDNRRYYAHAPDGTLINDTGCGNTLNAAEPIVRQLVLDTLRHFVRHCGVDGFRFDLAPVIARAPGFDKDAPIFAEIAADPLLSDRIMIAEPWDTGPGGYQLGQFPDTWLEWNDRYRDDVRRFWRGDGTAGALAKRLAGSADIFGASGRSVNFLAAHDGFTLADTVSYAARHNEANGEGNRDGHGDNFSWNNGAEGPTDDSEIGEQRRADLKALLATLFASTGTIMLTAGDEYGRSQRGNNNAYAQDNVISWVDWNERDLELEAFVAALAATRANHTAMFADFPAAGEWARLDGAPMTVADWDSPETPGFVFRSHDPLHPLSLRVDRALRKMEFATESHPEANASQT
jgi:glycogen operon protein